MVTNVKKSLVMKQYKSMVTIRTLLIISLTMAHCSFAKAEKIPGTNVEEKSFELRVIDKKSSSRGIEGLIADCTYLNYYIGGYPPRFSSEKERDDIYSKWTELISEAEYWAKIEKNEKTLYLLADLYRQGHNMDIIGSGDLAINNINLCLNKYPKSIPCHFTSMYFNLSAGEAFLGKGKESLDFLREYYGANKNPDIEAGYIHYYMLMRDNESAKEQIKRFIKIFPKHRDGKFFEDILPALDNKIEINKDNKKSRKENITSRESAIIAREAEKARVDINHIKFLRENYINYKARSDKVQFGENKETRDRSKKVAICALYAAGYKEEAQDSVRETNVTDFFTEEITGQCSNLLTKPIKNNSELDNIWAAYAVSNDVKYLKMIIEPIRNLMNVAGVTKGDLEYISYVTHNYKMEESMKLLNGLLNKGRSEEERDVIELGIRGLWSFGSVVKVIPKLKQIVDENQLLLNDSDLENQLRIAHYSSYCQKVATGSSVSLFPAKKGATSRLNIKDDPFKDAKHEFKEGEEGELMIIQGAYSKKKIKPQKVIIITPNSKEIKTQFFKEDKNQNEGSDKAKIMASHMAINSSVANEKGLYFIFYEKDGNYKNEKCTYFYQE